VEARFSAPVQTSPEAYPASCTVGTGSFPGAKRRPERDANPSTLLVPWSRKSRAIPLLPLWAVRPVQSFGACTVQLYLYSPQCLYSTAIPLLPLGAVQPLQSLSACTVQLYLYSPQCLYSRAIPLLPLWAVRPVQSFGACTRVTFTFTFLYFRVFYCLT